jgi:HSP20 family molecular chaperone IbpA
MPSRRLRTAESPSQNQPKGSDRLSLSDLQRPPALEDGASEPEFDEMFREIREQLSGAISGPRYSRTPDGLIIKGKVRGWEKLALKVEAQTLTLSVDVDGHRTIARSFAVPKSVDTAKIQAYLYDRLLTIVIPRRGAEEEQESLAARRPAFSVKINTSPVSTEIETDRILLRAALEEPSVLSHIRRPGQFNRAAKMLEDDRIISREGKRYFPISLAADFAQVPRTTLLDWINAKVEFQGRSLTTYDSPTARKRYLTEESVDRLTRRFIKWPSKKPAGQVVIGETDDETGYIGIAKAARAIPVDHHTIWLWIKKGSTPIERPLDVIKCSASDQLYIREKDVAEIKRVIPRPGLRRGRRPRQLARPS